MLDLSAVGFQRHSRFSLPLWPLHVGPAALPRLLYFWPHQLRFPPLLAMQLLALPFSLSQLPLLLPCTPRPPSIIARRPEPQG